MYFQSRRAENLFITHFYMFNQVVFRKDIKHLQPLIQLYLHFQALDKKHNFTCSSEHIYSIQNITVWYEKQSYRTLYAR